LCSFFQMVFLCLLALVILFLHMFHLLRNDQRSSTCVRMIRSSLITLFIQICVPFTLLIVPAFVLFTSVACDCIPFEVSVSTYFVLTLHPAVHSIVLLASMSTYRRYI
ncbi:hypothetical protein PFISCL1PPCAC_14334, partial [Pristionchus fissidentatus]